MRVFDPNVCFYRNKVTFCNGKGNKTRVKERMLQIDHSPFLWYFKSKAVWEKCVKVLLAFGTTSFGKERPADVDFEQLNTNKICFGVLKSTQLTFPSSKSAT